MSITSINFSQFESFVKQQIDEQQMFEGKPLQQVVVSVVLESLQQQELSREGFFERFKKILSGIEPVLRDKICQSVKKVFESTNVPEAKKAEQRTEVVGIEEPNFCSDLWARISSHLSKKDCCSLAGVYRASRAGVGLFLRDKIVSLCIKCGIHLPSFVADGTFWKDFLTPEGRKKAEQSPRVSKYLEEYDAFVAELIVLNGKKKDSQVSVDKIKTYAQDAVWVHNFLSGIYEDSLDHLVEQIPRICQFSKSLLRIPPRGAESRLEKIQAAFSEIAATGIQMSITLRGGSLIPEELFLLTNITDLRIRGNFCTSISGGIRNLVHLIQLNISGCRLQTLPPEIGALSELQYLDLEANQLTGLPPEIGALSKLRYCNVSINQLKDIPVEIGLLTNLKYLHLGLNQLRSVPSEIGACIDLEILDLRGNQLTTLPADVKSLTRLHYVDLGQNQLIALPSEIGMLSNLRFLRLQKNQLTTLPPEIGSIASLENLYLDENPFTALPLEMRNLRGLREITLGKDQELLPDELKKYIRRYFM